MPAKSMLTSEGGDNEKPQPYRPHGEHDVPILPPVAFSQHAKVGNAGGAVRDPHGQGLLGGGTPHGSRPGSSRADAATPAPKTGAGNDQPSSGTPVPGAGTGEDTSHIGGGGGGGTSMSFPPQPADTRQQSGGYGSGSPTDHYRFLSPDEWARVAHGLGAIKTGEEHVVVHPKRCLWAQRGLPDGLYRQVVTQRTKYRVMYHGLSTLRWMLMILQIILGAILTALGSVKLPGGSGSTPITVIAACQTVIAGLLALLHNSGVPERYRSNRTEFSKVEDHLRELLDTGVVPQDQSIDAVIADCWARYQRAKNTVQANMPANYIPSSNLSSSSPPPKSGTAAFMKHVAGS